MNMNPLNYASLEASKKLVEAGIVMETEFYHRIVPKTLSLPEGFYEIVSKATMQFCQVGDEVGDGRDIDGVVYYPAPSMAEVWRELPEVDGCCKYWQGDIEMTCVWTDESPVFESANPTDALIDLKIWTVEQERKECDT